MIPAVDRGDGAPRRGPSSGGERLDESEVMIMVVFAVLAGFGIFSNTTAGYHPLYFRGNPAPGVVRVGIILAMCWIGYVLWRHADPSVTGPYVWFYLLMGYAVVKVFGQSGASWFGLRSRVDAAERRNVPAAVVAAAFILATGLIFGGSLWGEADPVGDDEGGWWIPLAFFLLGWIALVAAFKLYELREGRGIGRRLQRERNLEDARAATFFLLASAVALTDAVAGDFWGWRHGLLTFGLLAGLLLVHEVFSAFARPEGADARAPERAGPTTGPVEAALPRRGAEAALYALLGLTVWLANRYLDLLFGAG
jgi:hypothetical protein